MKILLFIVISFVPAYVLSQNEGCVVYTKKKGNEAPIELTKEQTFIKEYFPYKNLADWELGMKFLVKERKGYSDDNINWIEVYLNSVYEKNVKCPKGKCLRTYVDFYFKSNELYYTAELFDSKDEIRNNKTYVIQYETIRKKGEKYTLDFVYVGDFNKARELLIGKTLYIMSKAWLSDNEPFVNVMKKSKKFIPIQISDIGVNVGDFPIKVIFTTPDNEEYYVNIQLSGINSKKNKSADLIGYLFEDIFQFDDPRISYPNISDEVWDYVINGIPKIGMTKTECTLAIGEPDKVNTSMGADDYQEQWVYGQNRYIYFENDKLSYIQF